MATLKVPVTANDHIRGPLNAPVTLLNSAITNAGIAEPRIPEVKRV